MALKNELLQSVKDNLNINAYEVKIWSALLSRGISTAAELSEISGVPRSRCYDVLESLEKKGFIIMKIGKPIKYIAINPEEVIHRVKKEAQEEEKRLINSFDKIKGTDIFKELQLLHNAGIASVNAEELSDFLMGRSEVTRKLKEMMENAKKSITIYTTKEGYDRKVKLLKNILPDLKKKKVNVYVNAPVEENELKDIKFSDNTNSARFVSIDGEEALLHLNDGNCLPAYDCAVYVKSPFFVKAIEEMANNK